MSSANELMDETLRHLRSGNTEELNQLESTINSSVTAFTAEHAMGAIQARTVVEIDLELMYVWSVNNQVATVQRGFSGTTATSHTAGALITVNPRFSRFALLQAMNDELQSLSSPLSGLFRMRTVSLTYNPTHRGYDLTGLTSSNVLDVYGIQAEGIGSDRSWFDIPFEFQRDLPTTDFASGMAIFINHGDPGRTIQVMYKASFNTIDVSDVDVDLTHATDSAGLHTEAHDIVALGAAVRLMAPREVKRNFIEAEGDSRRADEVPPGATLQSYRGILALRDERINAERSRLNQRYPQKRRW